MAIAFEVFANNPSTTVATNGYNGGSATGDAPAAGTTETWTVSSSAEFPAASSSGTPPTQFHIADPAAPTEIIQVTNVSGTTWSVTRGGQSTTPVTHAAGATFYQIVVGATVAEEQFVLGSAVTGGTGTSAQNITGLAVSLSPGNYLIEARANFVTTGTIGTTGLTNFGIATSGAPTVTSVALSGWCTTASTTAADFATYSQFTSTTFSGTMFSSPARSGSTLGDGSQMMWIWGTLVVSVAGTLQVTFANTVSADTVNISAGSILRARRLTGS